jgi:hypothetical protein
MTFESDGRTGSPPEPPPALVSAAMIPLDLLVALAPTFVLAVLWVLEK